MIESDYLDPFQFSFSLGLGTETALVTMVDDLRRDLDPDLVLGGQMAKGPGERITSLGK